MRILFITHYFQPEPNFFFGLPFAKELVRRGHEVEVITGFPNYPGGKIYDGYKGKWFQKEIMDEIPVTRVPVYPSHDQSSFKRILCYSTLSMSQSIFGPWMTKKADVAYVVQGPATLGMPASIFKWFKRIPFVYNIQDLWPDTLLSTGMFKSKIGLKMLHSWCEFIYRQSGKITVIAPGMKETLIQRGVPSEKVDVVYNWCDDQLICRVPRNERLAEELNMAGKFNLVYAGNMGAAQSLDEVIRAAALLKTEYPDIQFVMIGSGMEVENLKELSALLKLDNVLFLARRPISEIGPILRLADALFVHLKDDPLFRITIPSKTQAYMATGRPILIAVNGDASDLVKQADAGVVCPPQNPESIAQAAISLYKKSSDELEAMGHRAMNYYDQNLSFSVATSRYEEIFKHTAKID